MHFLSSHRGALFATLLFGLVCGRANAATFTVTNTSDTDDTCTASSCSLREAIKASNLNTSDDTILFAPDVKGAIVLTAGELAVGHNLTITGPGRDDLEISGNYLHRVFNITGGVVTVSKLSINRGANCSGAGFYITEGSQLTINNCFVAGNAATSATSAVVNYGGGIYNAGLTRVNDTFFSLNSTTGSTFTSGLEGRGGAIYNAASGFLWLNNSTVQGSSANLGEGGGLYNAGNAEVSKTIFYLNRAVASTSFFGGYGRGAAISNSGGLTLKDSTIQSNRGWQGAGLYNTGFLTLSSSTFAYNQATGISPGKFATGQGGAIYNDPGINSVGIVNCTFYQNSIEGSFSGDYDSSYPKQSGGAIFNASGTSSIMNCTFYTNADNTRGVYPTYCISTLVDFGHLTIQNTVFAQSDLHPFLGFTNPGSKGDRNKNFLFPEYSSPSTPSVGLSSYGDHGGPTYTFAIMPGSPLIDAGLATGAPTTDARGQARPQGAGVDVGAFEGLDPSFYFTDLTLSPTGPKTQDTLKASTVVYNATAKAFYTYVWKKNGEVIKTTSKSKSKQDRLDLSLAGNGDKNDEITVEITASSGTGYSSTRSKSVRILNTTPLLNEVKLSPLSPTPTQKVTASFRGGDVDTADKVTPIYKWKIGDTFASTEKGATLDLSKYPGVKAGDVITVELRLNDGMAESKTLKAFVTVKGVPGALTASPNPSAAAF